MLFRTEECRRADGLKQAAGERAEPFPAIREHHPAGNEWAQGSE